MAMLTIMSEFCEEIKAEGWKDADDLLSKIRDDIAETIQEVK